VHGSGSLNITGKLIDVGNLTLQGIGRTSFEAGAGEVRGSGTLSASGELVITAGVLHPTTAGRFDIFTYDYESGGFLAEGSITFNPGENRPLPLSAGGALRVFATQISQGGTLRSPLGSITLGWNGAGMPPGMSSPARRSARR
jgi:filamentous hemagglutinin